MAPKTHTKWYVRLTPGQCVVTTNGVRITNTRDRGNAQITIETPAQPTTENTPNEQPAKQN